MSRNCLNTNQQVGRNYAGALTEGVVLVKPTQACESKVTKQRIRQNMSDLGVGITVMRDAREGAVVIKCKDDADPDANKLKFNLQLPKLFNNYDEQ